jgi:hypothetical protein
MDVCIYVNLIQLDIIKLQDQLAINSHSATYEYACMCNFPFGICLTYVRTGGPLF